MTRSFLLNDSVCKTFTSKCKRILHPGPIFGMGIVIYLTLIGLWIHFSTLVDVWKSFTYISLFFYCSLSIFIFRSYALSAWYGPGFVELGWKPKDPKDQTSLQYCRICDGYKAPRSHHCKACGRCVLKMDHHCPWINTCVGSTLCTYRIYYVFTRFFSIFRDVHDHRMIFSFYEIILVVIGLGVGFGVVIAVGGLAYCQIRGILRNRTVIEDWIMTKAHHRREYDLDLKEMVFPYDLGWRTNLRQVEQLQQKAHKTKSSVLLIIKRSYSGSIMPVTFGCRTLFCPPCSGEGRVAVSTGDVVLVSRSNKYWYYGQVMPPPQNNDVQFPKVPIKGWFPRLCVSTTNDSSGEDKRKQN
ncbi:unnamed protein product [Rodentolepis nana]|uniref:Palmitoyltransferase n=1 Tax=Rodentolepis nana TaxID=102285 RepID=A0A0R3TYB0_RODNA|nr:unnamed protein product [Rodentolepis nana]